MATTPRTPLSSFCPKPAFASLHAPTTSYRKACIYIKMWYPRNRSHSLQNLTQSLPPPIPSERGALRRPLRRPERQSHDAQSPNHAVDSPTPDPLMSRSPTQHRSAPRIGVLCTSPEILSPPQPHLRMHHGGSCCPATTSTKPAIIARSKPAPKVSTMAPQSAPPPA